MKNRRSGCPAPAATPEAVLRELLSAPTAPYHEQAVIVKVHDWASRCGVEFRQDKFGNVVLHHRQGRAKTRWFFEAHMDHPGFLVKRCHGLSVEAEFLGSVRTEFFPSSRVRLYAPEGSHVAIVQSVKKSKSSPFLQCSLKLRRPAVIPAETIGMWDLPDMRLNGKRLSSRGCDDVVGCAGVLCAIERIIAAGFDCDVTGLLTRAEEVGFIGTLAACRDGTIPADALVVGIETSKAQPAGRLGSGVVVRVGDAVRTFDPSLTAHVTAVAAEAAKRDATFRFTRQLMPGGACESSAYLMMGYQTTGLCIPLGNYHNMGPGGKIASEQVDMDDFENLVRLLVALASDRGSVRQTDEKLRQRLNDILTTRGGYF